MQSPDIGPLVFGAQGGNEGVQVFFVGEAAQSTLENEGAPEAFLFDAFLILSPCFNQETTWT